MPVRTLGEAADLLSQDRLDEAETILRRAIVTATASEHYILPELHELLGQVLVRAERDAEGIEQLEIAVASALRQSGGGCDNSVSTARYMLAEQLIRCGNPSAALAAVNPSLGEGSAVEHLLCAISAEALWALGRVADAQASASLAVQAASSPEQQEQVRVRLEAILAAR